MPVSGQVAGSAPLRALVVEDSITIRKYLAGVLRARGVEVVGEAADGQSAVDLCRTLRPDVVTMDMILPVLSGLAATEQIMAYSPTPILIVSASVNRGEMFQTYDALAAGAVDVFDKVRAGAQPASGPAGVSSGDSSSVPLGVKVQQDWEERFVAAVRMAARIKVITHPRARLAPARAFAPRGVGVSAGGSASAESDSAGSVAGSPVSLAASAPLLRESGTRTDVIALGASTGGPAALVEILRALPANFPVPILIVLHISELFSFAFAEWLNTLSPIPAHYARDGELLEPPGKPQAILAPAGRHLTLEGRVLRLRDSAERHSCKPSIDVLFESLAAQPDCRSLLCLLTGMGKDGAAGLLAARRAGLRTVAQDEASSVIFGMPGEAVRLGAAGHILPLDAMAPFLIAASASGSGRASGRAGGRPSGERAAS